MSDPQSAVNTQRVAVVHGRNETVKDSLFGLLRAMGLDPIEWSTAIQLTGNAAPTIKDAIEAMFGSAQAVVALLTPDDIAKLRDEFVTSSIRDQFYEAKLLGQARPNVLFEIGLAFGHHPTRTILVEVGDTKPFSDIAGVHMVKLSNSPNAKMDLYNRLRKAGCRVTESGSDWLTYGDFSIEPLKHALQRKSTGRVIHGPARESRGEEPDTPENRLRYRANAHLASYVVEHLELADAFTELNLLRSDWWLHANTRDLILVVRTVNGKQHTASIAVDPDWPKGGSWGYALKLANVLLEEIRNQV